MLYLQQEVTLPELCCARSDLPQLRLEYGDEREPEMAAFFEKSAPLNNSGKISKPLFVVKG